MSSTTRWPVIALLFFWASSGGAAEPAVADLTEAQLAGVRYDARGGDVKWDADWSVAVGCRDDEYGVEFRIPYAALGAAAPRPGDKWAINVLRGRQHGPKWERFSQWVPTYAAFDSPTHFGELTFK